MAFTESGTTFRAGKFDTCLQMLDSDSAIIQINVLYLDTQSFRNAASQVRKQPDKQSIPEIIGSFF